MRRLCFDTESSFYHSGLGIVDVEALRDSFQHKIIRFDCGVIYDEQIDRYYEFTVKNVVKMAEILKEADEIISHSGSRGDLIVLEHACGKACVAPLHRIKHYDLFYMCQGQTLDTLTEQYFPDHFAVREADYKRRYAQADAESPYNFVPAKLVTARHDVERTYAIFKKLNADKNGIMRDSK